MRPDLYEIPCRDCGRLILAREVPASFYAPADFDAETCECGGPLDFSEADPADEYDLIDPDHERDREMDPWT